MIDKKVQFWRCACGKQMLSGEIPKGIKDGDGRSLQICQTYPECGNEPMSKDEWNRYRHLAAITNEVVAQKWKEEDLPKLRKRKEKLAEFFEKKKSVQQNLLKEN